MSFFDDGEETASQPPRRASKPRPAGTPAPRRPRPRRPQGGAPSHPLDQHTLMVRRRILFGVGIVALIVIVLVVNGCLKSEQQQALRNYNHEVSTLALESDEQVTHPLFTTLTDASGKSALNVSEQINQLRIQAQNLANRAKGLSTPGAMSSAQRYLLLVFDLRVEALNKLANLVPEALGGKNKQAFTLIAGDMEIFLASDVVYSQRVAPLIQQTLASNNIHGLATSPTHSLPNLGWLEPTTVTSRMTGQASSAQNGAVTGNHGSALTGVSVGGTALETEPALNHIKAAGNPTFTVNVEDSGEFPETNVKVNLTVTAAGKQLKASRTIEKTEPGKTVSVAVPVTGVPTGAAKVEANVEGVPGENDLENNKGTYLAIFE